MKKYITLFLVVVLICCSPLSAFAQENEFTIKTQNVTALPGDTVAVKFSFENNPGISLFTFELNYDKTVLTLKEINGNSLMGGSFIDNVNEDYLLWMSSSKDSTFNGTVFTAIFEVSKEAPFGQTDVSISLPYSESNVLNYVGDDIEIQIISGYVNLQNPVKYGDINNDGKIDSLDLSLLRIVLLSKDPNYSDNITCDVDANNTIDIKDLVRLKKFIAGFDVTLGAN